MNTPFYIALRYLIAKKGSQAVSFITGLSAIAMMVAVTAMFIVISIFSGLEELNKELISNLHADLTIKSKSKELPDIDKIIPVLEKEHRIKSFSKVIEEKVYINYNGNGEIAYLRGVDLLYTQVNPIHKSVIYGEYISFDYPNDVIIEAGLTHRLGIPIVDEETATVFIPKAGEGVVRQEEDVFNKKNIVATGVFTGNEQLNNYIFAPIHLIQELLGVPKNTAYQIVIKLKNSEDADEVKKSLMENLNNPNINIHTQLEENKAFWKMINTEKLMIYLIFILVIFITTFNLAGAIIILQLDKKQQSKTLISLGFTISQLRKVYFYTGILIVGSGVVLGIALGSLLCFFQLQTGFFKASVGLDLPFPVKITAFNYFIVIFSALFFGFVVSWVFSKINKNYLSSN
ncbi:MAG: ABC transporter permease [Flavobacteriaceae bacterium]|nr:ABC transporter permease [Flavobacteriaceae bacterium]